jgi:FixJ family two-component response regulator
MTLTKGRMTRTRALICVVDDDESVRESLPDLLKELGYDVQAFSSAEEFLASSHVARSRCLIADVSMPGMTGPELQLELGRRQQQLPIIFITAQIDAGVRLGLLKRGASACLYKPFTDDTLLAAIRLALGEPELP